MLLRGAIALICGGAVLLAQQSRSYTREEILATVPQDPIHPFPLVAAGSDAAIAPDGTAISVVLHQSEKFDPLNSQGPEQLLRVWARNRDGYSLLKESGGNDYDGSNVSFNFFHFKGQLYLYIVARWPGNANVHEDEILRVERNLIPVHRSSDDLLKSIQLEKDEVPTSKGLFDSFSDNGLTFEFWVRSPDEPGCCGHARIQGTFAIVGDELRVATWTRVPEN